MFTNIFPPPSGKFVPLSEPTKVVEVFDEEKNSSTISVTKWTDPFVGIQAEAFSASSVLKSGAKLEVTGPYLSNDSLGRVDAIQTEFDNLSKKSK